MRHTVRDSQSKNHLFFTMCTLREFFLPFISREGICRISLHFNMHRLLDTVLHCHTSSHVNKSGKNSFIMLSCNQKKNGTRDSAVFLVKSGNGKKKCSVSVFLRPIMFLLPYLLPNTHALHVQLYIMHVYFHCKKMYCNFCSL